MNNDPIPIRNEGANFFDKIVFVTAPKINPHYLLVVIPLSQTIVQVNQ